LTVVVSIVRVCLWHWLTIFIKVVPLQSIEKLCGLEPQHTQPVKDTTSSGNNTPRTNQRDRRYSNRGRNNNQGNRRHKQPNYFDPYYSWGNSYQYYCSRPHHFSIDCLMFEASIVTPSSFRWYPSRSSSMRQNPELRHLINQKISNQKLFCLELQTPRTLIPTNGRANSTVKKSTNIL
jgi:hypothetical protein